MYAKFEVSSLNRSRDMEGSQNFKSMSLEPLSTTFDLILHFTRYKSVPSDHHHPVMLLS